MSPTPKGIMKLTPKMDKLVNNFWQQKTGHGVVEATFTLNDTSTDESQVQPAAKI